MFAKSGISSISILKNVHLEIVSYNKMKSDFALKKLEEFIYYGKS
jgi:hypothetical protein